MIYEKVAVYGTLRRDCYNHHVLEGCPLLWEGFIKMRYEMRVCGFPMLVPCDKLKAVYVEVYSVGGDVMDALDLLEGYPELYDRIKVMTPVGEAWLYVASKSMTEHARREWEIIEHGDYVYWRKEARRHE